MSEDGHEYSLYSIARDVALPHCCLRKPDAESNITTQLGGSTVASWPLSTETVAALTTKYSGRIPAQDVTISGLDIAENEYFSESNILSDFNPDPDGDEFSMTFSMTLAHFAIDLTGDASMFKPATKRPPRYTFATVVYFFPSTCVGGAVTISHGHRTTTFEALDGRFLSFYKTCDVTVAPITSGHRSFAVYHAVYDLADFDYAVKPRYAPPPLPSLQELQLAARRFEPNGDNDVVIRLATRSATPTFGSLMGHDKAILDLLLAADVFDIAIARAGEGDESKSDDESEIESEIESEVESEVESERPDECAPTPSETFHPLCTTPALVQDAYHQTPINELADTDEIKSPGCFLLVWPKAHRVRILGYDRTIGLLRANVDGDVTEHLGYGSLQSIFEAAFRAFYPQRQSYYNASKPPQATHAMASVLYDHGDVGLIEAFLDVHDHWADDENMVDWLLAVLRRFGPARFQRQLQTVEASSAFAAHVVHLATAGDRLAQTIACDCIPLWWPRLLRHLTRDSCFTKKEKLGKMLDVETYMLEYPMDVTAMNYLRRQVPDTAVRTVATYVTPPLVPLLDVVRVDKCLVGSLPAVVWPRRDALGSVRLAACIALAVDHASSSKERPRCCKGHVLYLALLTAGTPAFAIVDADVQPWRYTGHFKAACAAVDKASLTAMQTLVLEEYMRRPS